MAYAGPVLALVAGVLGFLYSKGGERQRLGGVGYLLLALLLVSGGVSLLGVYRSDQAKAAADRQKQKADQATARAKAAEAAARTAEARERSLAETFRDLLVARTFAPDDGPLAGLLMIDLPRTAAEKAGGREPRGMLWPLLGAGVVAAHLSMNVDEAAVLDYKMRPAGAGAVIDAAGTEEGGRACRLTSDDGYDFSAAAGASCDQPGGYRPNAAFEETAAGGDSFEIELPRKPFWMTFSRIDQEQRIGDQVGQLTIETADAATLRALLADAAGMAVGIKFFRPPPAGSGPDACATSLMVHLGSSLRQTGPTTATLAIGGITGTDINYCEINLAD